MRDSSLDLGLLLDVDGPIASPVTRTIAIDSILDDLVALTAAGVPIAFITGRSDVFVREQVVEPLLAAGLADALTAPNARMFGVFEKGAAWASIGPQGLGEVVVDSSVAIPADLRTELRALHAAQFTETMFWDDTKRAMVSVEQHRHVEPSAFRAAQEDLVDAAFRTIVGLGHGVRVGSRSVPDGDGAIPWRIDPTIISIDIESVELDKDRGAERAFDYFRSLGELPTRWRSVGDSRSDYKMADYVHSLGLEVAHVDVRPAEGVPATPYRVVIEGDLIHDEAGAAFLAYWRERIPA